MRRRTFLGSAAAIGTTLAGASAGAATSAIRIGLTAVILAEQAAFLTRWSAYLSERVGVKVVFVPRDSYQSILDLLFSDQLDAAWICGYPYVRQQQQLQLLAVPVYERAPLYRSYLIRNRADTTELQGWSDLRQRVLAYSDPLSNSGWLVAQGQLRAAGLGARDLKRTFFVHSHRNVIDAVASGLAHAGCVDGYIWETLQLQNMALVDQTQVIWKSGFYAFPPIVTRKGNKNRALPGLGMALLAMHDDAEGKELLRALNLDGFSTASPALFDSIKALAASVNAVRN